MSKLSVWAAASTADELGCDPDGAFDAAVQPATVDPDAAAFDPTKFDKSLDKRTAARGGRLLPNSPASTQWSESGKFAARAGSGHATLAAPVLLMKSRRRTASPKAPDHARLRRQGLHYIRDLSPVKWARRPLCRGSNREQRMSVVGPHASLLRCPSCYRFSADRDQIADVSSLRFRARRRHETYSITSSARASNVGGTVRPSALAVLRLITSSYLVAA